VPSGNPTDAFKAHSNYIRAFAQLVAPRIHLPRAMLQAVATAVKALPPGKTTAPNVDGALNSLSIAWRTESLLDWTAHALPEDAFAKLANTWAVIQVYYVFYHATQALAQAKGFVRPHSHPKTRDMFYDYWAGRSLALAPWSFAVGHDGPRNVAPGVAINDAIHVWERCDHTSCWSLAAKALRTTREEAISDAIKRKRFGLQRDRMREWEQKEAKRVQDGRKARIRPTFPRPILSAGVKSAVEQGVRPFTVMDYLYRLRLRTNYRDAAIFTDGPEEQGESLAVLNDLRRLCSATLLLHEITLARLLGGDVLRQHASSFLTSTAPPSSVFVYLRERIGFIT